MNPRRRPRLRTSALALTALALVSACVGGKAAAPTPSESGFPPVSADPVQPAAHVDATAFATRWPIKHVVFLIKENRSFDSLFGRFPGADGATSANDHGTIRPLTPGEDQRQLVDIPHCYSCQLHAVDGGRMDGFNIGTEADQVAFTQMSPDQIPAYWAWANRFVLSDRFFASALGPSFPNHMFSIAATSGRTHDNPHHHDPAELNKLLAQGYAKSWGCDIGPGGYVLVYDSEGVPTEVSPCFDFLTEGDLLNHKHIPWAYYGATNREYGYIFTAYSSIRRYREHPAKWARSIRPVDDVVHDIEHDLLPPVTWITPRGELSDHPGSNNSFCHGQNWTTEVVNAIMASPMWKDTVIFVTWDDYGGFYDHVPPVRLDDFGLGIRVPMLMISPYAKAGTIDHTQGEFSSVLRFIEDNWGLTQLTRRDKIANNLAHNFDFTQTPIAPDPQPLRTDCAGPIFTGPPNT